MGDDRDTAHTRHMTPIQSVSNKKRNHRTHANMNRLTDWLVRHTIYLDLQTAACAVILLECIHRSIF